MPDADSDLSFFEGVINNLSGLDDDMFMELISTDVSAV
jgi:hypothetical protein